MSPPARPRYAIVGTGGRAYLYLTALTGEHRHAGELVALCDTNPGRLARAAGIAADAGVHAARAVEPRSVVSRIKPEPRRG